MRMQGGYVVFLLEVRLNHFPAARPPFPHPSGLHRLQAPRSEMGEEDPFRRILAPLFSALETAVPPISA